MDSRKYNEKDVTASLDGIAEAIKSGGLAPSVIADPYSNEATYSVGDYITFNAKSYRCITAIDTPEEFDSEKWDEIKVLDELASAVELPPVTSTDNGKILSVVEGEWSKADAPSGGGYFEVKIYQDSSEEWVADKTYQEIKDAYDAGNLIIFTYVAYGIPLIAGYSDANGGSFLANYSEVYTNSNVPYLWYVGIIYSKNNGLFVDESDSEIPSGPEDFVITMSISNGHYSLDKNNVEIFAACEAKKNLILKINDIYNFKGYISLSSYTVRDLDSSVNNYLVLGFSGFMYGGSDDDYIVTVTIEIDVDPSAGTYDPGDNTYLYYKTLYELFDCYDPSGN